jgi:hypothetical protein
MPKLMLGPGSKASDGPDGVAEAVGSGFTIGTTSTIGCGLFEQPAMMIEMKAADPTNELKNLELFTPLFLAAFRPKSTEVSKPMRI